MNAYFIFKGINSKDYSIKISELPPITTPQKRVADIVIAGRSGDLSVVEEAYDSYVLSIECGKRGTDKLDDIIAWLQGSGDLILSHEADKVYKARIVNSIQFSDVVYLYNSFLVQFKVFPFKYSVNSNSDFLELTRPLKIYNKGTVYSEPIIKIYANDNVSLVINDISYHFKNVNNHITIDSEILEVFEGNNQNANNKFLSDEFPKFNTGENSISWTGSAIKIEITPNWRWL